MEDSATILSVEDDPDVRELVDTVLAKAGFRVMSAATAEAALRFLEGDEPIDLLLTDVVMPGMNGMGLARVARRLRPQLRVLYTSGYWPHIVNEPADSELVRKPYVLTQLIAQVRRSLDATELDQLAI
jgi:DNA-binding NtrC family response regulator